MKAEKLTEMYIESLKKWGKPFSYIYCVRLFDGCIKETLPGAEAAVLRADFFKFFFNEWLPYNICQEDDEVIEAICGRVKDLCRFCDRKAGTELLRIFNSISPLTVAEAKRIMYVKKHIMQFIKSPVINKRPAIIDLERYRVKADVEARYGRGMMPEEGYFKVADIFTNNSVVLKKISGYTFFIRVYLDEPVIKKIRPGDVLDIRVRKMENMNGWSIEDISGCLARESV